MGIGRGDVRRSLIFLVFLLGGIPVLEAQGRIDPSLPPEPIEFTRTLLLFPGADTVKNPEAVLPPLTRHQKYLIFWRRTFDFSLPVEALMFAGGSQAVQYSPHYGTGGVAFAERFGYYMGSIATNSFFSDALLPTLFHEDPRYFRMGRGRRWTSRLLYAIESDFVTRTDSGKKTFNFSGVLGFGMSTALSNAWGPRQSITTGGTMSRLGVKFGLSSVINIIREFGGTDE